MSAWKGLRARLRSLRARAAEARMDEEFRFHLEMETEQNIRQGLPPSEARRRARLAFGGVDAQQEAMRDGRGARFVSDVLHDVRFALRGMRRAPVLTLVAVVTIALGVGATTALFSLANAVLLRELPVPGAGRVVSLQEHRSGMVSTGPEGYRIPWSRYEMYRESTRDLFMGLAAQRDASVSLRTTGEAEQAFAATVSGEYFEVLGLHPALGRFPTADDEEVVVLSHGLWQSRFGGASDVIGATAWIDGRPFTIAAIAPESFAGTTFGMVPQVWIPFVAYAAGRDAGFEQWVGPFGRLRPEVPVESARAALEALAMRTPEEGSTVRRVTLDPMGGVGGEGRRIAAQFMTMLVAAALLVLFIAAANIAGTLLARALARRREIAVRLSIGAGRWRLVRQLLTETMLLFALGGGAGVLLAYWLTDLLGRMEAPAPGMNIRLVATPDVTVLAFAVVITIVPALLFGLLPALQATRFELLPALREGAPGGSARTVRMRSVFVAGQLAMAVLLLVTAGLFVRSLRHGLNLDPGFRTDGIVVASVNVAPHGYDEARGRAFHEQLVSEVRRQPGVTSVGLAQRVLLAGASHSTSMRPREGDPEGRIPVTINVVDTAYMRTLGMTLAAGRGFTAQDAPGAPLAVIVNETLARRAWPDGSAIGSVLMDGSRELHVVGIARDGKYTEVGEPQLAFAFLPMSQRYTGMVVLHVAGTAPPEELIAHVRRSVRELDPNIAIDFSATLAAMTEITLFPQRFAARLVGVLGLLGLLLAGVGVYGVLMYHVAQRIREFGIRIALGARAADIARGVMVRSLRVTAAGVTIGLVLAWFAARLLGSFIFGIGVRDPVTFAAVPLLLAGFALLAAWHPARRATRADPMEALRAD